MAALLSLFKLRIVGLLVILAVATTTVAAPDGPQLKILALLVVVGTLACAGASALNNFIDRDIDAAMRRTRQRVLPRRSMHPGLVLLVGCLFTMLAVILAMWLSIITAAFVFAGAFIYVVIYTLVLKRRSPLNIVIGGLAGSCAVMAGWTAVNSSLSLTAILMAALLFVWTPSSSATRSRLAPWGTPSQTMSPGWKTTVCV